MKDSRLEEMKLALEEIRARNAYTIVITDCYEELDHKLIDFVFEIPFLDYVSGILSIIPIQLTCLELSKLKNINPDKPRNLAKCVTVM
jgi:glutamine---fructose-6-phosphate transaminase (isomerizing)